MNPRFYGPCCGPVHIPRPRPTAQERIEKAKAKYAKHIAAKRAELERVKQELSILLAQEDAIKNI